MSSCWTLRPDAFFSHDFTCLLLSTKFFSNYIIVGIFNRGHAFTISYDTKDTKKENTEKLKQQRTQRNVHISERQNVRPNCYLAESPVALAHIRHSHAFTISNNPKDKGPEKIQKSLNSKAPKEIFISERHRTRGQLILTRVHLLHIYFILMLTRKKTMHIVLCEVHPMNPTLSNLSCTFYLNTKHMIHALSIRINRHALDMNFFNL